MTVARQHLGAHGERVAARRYEADGYRVVARNWRCADGELDLVLRDRNGTVVFCEVKTRSGTGFGAPEEAVGPRKARKLRGLACRWLLEHRPPGGAEIRFDVVSIVRRRGCAPELRHLQGAF